MDVIKETYYFGHTSRYNTISKPNRRETSQACEKEADDHDTSRIINNKRWTNRRLSECTNKARDRNC